jgi:hypothetical protein
MLHKPRFYNKSYFPRNDGYFPQLTGDTVLNRAVHEGCFNSQAPESMVYLTALCNAALAVQGLADVKLPTGSCRPISVMGLTIAGSGERKSTVDNQFNKGAKAFEEKESKKYQKEEVKYILRKELHRDRATSIKRSLDLSDKEGSEEAYELLLAHNENAPSKPTLPKLFYEDVTPESLLSGIAENLPNAFFGSSEGGNVMTPRGMSKTSIYNAIWGGDDINVDRKVGKSFKLSGVRLTIHIMIQPDIFGRYMEKTKGEARDSGLFSRNLVCSPVSNCGNRQVSEAEHSTGNLDEFNEKVTKLLLDSLNLDSYTDRKIISFTDEAKRVWIDIANDIEINMQPNGLYCNAKDHASKLAENVARVAAIIHCFEYSLDDEISASTLWEAINLVSYFSGQFMNVFAAPPKYVTDAQNLMQWLSVYANSGIRYLKRNNILQFGPSGTRKKKDLETVLEYLKPNNDIAEMMSRKTRVIDLWPQQPFDAAKLNQDLMQDVVF